MTVTTTDWSKAWEEAQGRSPCRAHAAGAARWTCYWDQIAPSYLLDSVANEKTYRAVLSFLASHSCWKEGDSVLDIGCGSGTYTLLFAESARWVDALDMSRGMLGTLEGEAHTRGLSNNGTVFSSWEDHEPAKYYSLVFSGMSPAIHNEGSLLRMERWATRGCAVVTYAESFTYAFVKDLWPVLVGEYRSANAYHYSYPYGVLRQRGRKPVCELFKLSHLERVPLEDMVNRYLTYFGIFTEMDPFKAGVIRRYFQERCREGLFEVATQLKLAAMCWKVPRNADCRPEGQQKEQTRR